MNGVIINVKGGFHSDKDGQIHSNECCKIPRPLSREDKGLDGVMEFVEIKDWPLPVVPRIGESITLPDESGYGQEVTVEDVIYSAPIESVDIDIWVGGWTHWNAQSVRDLFARAQEYVEKERLSR